MLSQSIQGSSANSAENPLNHSPHERFFQIFFHPWHFLSKTGGSWQTETRYPIALANLWHAWQDETTIVGIRFGPTTRYGLIDIDISSRYHPRQDAAALDHIRHALETIGIYRTLLIRSSESEGLHLYIPLTELVPTFALAQTLTYALTSASLEIAPGTLEVFPNAKGYRMGSASNYNGHRLPLQRGSFLLNSDFQPVTNDLVYFLDVFEMASQANDNTELQNSFAIARTHARKSSFTQTGEPRGIRGKLWKLDCERTIEQGWTAHHQTNQILGVIAQYGRVFKGLADQALEAFILETAIECPGYAEFCRHQHEIQQRCKDWAHSAQRAYTPYRGDRSGNAWKEQKERELSDYNKQKSLSALERIQNAAADLRDSVGTLITSVRDWVKAIVERAGCSAATIYKHKSLFPKDLVCNSQKALAEDVTDTVEEASQTDAETLQPPSDGLLHTKQTYEGVGTPIAPLSFLKRTSTNQGTPRRHPPTDCEGNESPPAPS